MKPKIPEWNLKIQIKFNLNADKNIQMKPNMPKWKQ